MHNTQHETSLPLDFAWFCVGDRSGKIHGDSGGLGGVWARIGDLFPLVAPGEKAFFATVRSGRGVRGDTLGAA